MYYIIIIFCYHQVPKMTTSARCSRWLHPHTVQGDHIHTLSQLITSTILSQVITSTHCPSDLSQVITSTHCSSWSHPPYCHRWSHSHIVPDSLTSSMCQRRKKRKKKKEKEKKNVLSSPGFRRFLCVCNCKSPLTVYSQVARPTSSPSIYRKFCPGYQLVLVPKEKKKIGEGQKKTREEERITVAGNQNVEPSAGWGSL